jgi:GDSL-like Lipase/Acylhydrolase family
MAANVGLAAASLLSTLAVLEGVARLADEPAGPPVPALYTQYDPVLGWRHKPGVRVDFPQGSYSINSLGLRDEERGYAPADDDEERILILGDSFAEGFSVPFEDSVSQVLERNLRSTGRRADVINGGVVGYSTDQEYLLYRTDLARYGARVVVLLFFYNDILGNVLPAIGEAPKPVLCSEDESLHSSAPVPPPPRPESTKLHLHPPYPLGSAALEWARQRLSVSPRLYRASAHLGLWEAPEPGPPPEEFKVFKRRTPRAERRAWICTTHLLRALNDDVRAHGAELVVAYVPSKMEVSERDWGLTRLEYSLDEGVWDRGKVAHDLAGAAGDVGFRFVDLTGALRRADSPLLGGPYHPHGGHWNALGHRVAGDGIAAFLREQGLLTHIR